jgi:hypothetical protein
MAVGDALNQCELQKKGLALTRTLVRDIVSNVEEPSNGKEGQILRQSYREEYPQRPVFTIESILLAEMGLIELNIYPIIAIYSKK